MRLTHRVRTSASPSLVWQVLGTPARWPEFDLFLTKVRGADGPAAAGQHLVGISRWTVLGIPLDVVEATPEEKLVMRVRTAPAVTEELTFLLTPTTRGGTVITVALVVEGLLARPAVPVLWVANGLNVRVLATRTSRLAKSLRQSAA